MTQFLQFTISGLLIGGLYSLVGVTIVLVFKSTKVVSMAHGQVLAFGALFFWYCLMVFELSLWSCLFITVILTAVIGFLIERFTMRPLIGQPLFSAFLMTFAVFMFMDGIFKLIIGGKIRVYPPFLPQGVLDIGGITLNRALIVSFLTSLLLFLILALLFKYTRVGLEMRATAEDHRLSQSAGVRVRRIFSIAWIISAGVGAFAGIACANVVDIYDYLPFMGIKGLIVALIGGLDSIAGALLAGMILGLFENLSAGYLDPLLGGGVRDVAAYVMLLIILLVKPYGFFGLVRIERI